MPVQLLVRLIAHVSCGRLSISVSRGIFVESCLMKPNSRSVLTALKRIEPINFTVIATGSGPLLRYNVVELIYKYETWSKKALEKQLASVAVLYVSDYGFSDRLSQALARGLTKANEGVEMINLNSVDTQELVETIGKNGVVVVIAPPSSGSGNAIVSTTKFWICKTQAARSNSRELWW